MTANLSHAVILCIYFITILSVDGICAYTGLFFYYSIILLTPLLKLIFSIACPCLVAIPS